ncbi:unnamed protein product [Spodoptera exigua]|uniref:Uncharacterized protein n=1 Tax=Spodoptera exigua TaxID=7107 RepID=A0A922SA66_SPOEX|nr:hypothetical protein HF086_010718 [Spodoptera exigua]CAH0694378.1 unnamed protein product [Spodoptera exigua]
MSARPVYNCARVAHRNISRVISGDEHEPDSFSSKNMSFRNYMIAAALALAATLVSAKPSGMSLPIAVNKAVCRTVVEKDEDGDRIPRTIKVIKCAADPYEMCPAAKGKSMRCCGAFPLASGAQFSCTEVQDSVLVMKAKTFRPYVINVPVGCSCIRHSVSTAAE